MAPFFMSKKSNLLICLFGNNGGIFSKDQCSRGVGGWLESASVLRAKLCSTAKLYDQVSQRLAINKYSCCMDAFEFAIDF